MKRVAFIITLMAGLLFTSTVFASEYYEVSGDSMKPTLHNGDIVELVSSSYSEGDIVIADVGAYGSIVETVGAYGYTPKLVIKRVVGDLLIGDNRENTAVFNLNDTKVLGRAEKVKHTINNGNYKKVQAAISAKTLSGFRLRINSSYVYMSTPTYTYSIDGANVASGSAVPSSARWVVLSGFRMRINGSNVYMSNPTYTYSIDGINAISGASSVPANARWATLSSFRVRIDGDYEYSLSPTYDYSTDGVNIVSGSYIPSHADWATLSGFRMNIDGDNIYASNITYTNYTLSYNPPPVLIIDFPGLKQTVNINDNVNISGTAYDPNGGNVVISAAIKGQPKSQTVASGRKFNLSWAGSSLGTGSWSNISVLGRASNNATATAIYRGPIKVDPAIVYLPFKHSGSFTNGGGWGFGNKDADSYGNNGPDPVVTPRMLIYDGTTNQIILNATALYGDDESDNRQVDATSYSARIYIGIYGSGIRLGDITVTKGTPRTPTWDLVSFSGEWTLPNLSSSIYKNSGGIFVEMSRSQGNWTYSRANYWQFDASKVLYNSSVAAPTPPSITVVNGKPFSIVLSGITGKFVGTNNQYGAMSGYQSGANVVLSSISGLTGLPSSFTDLLVGSDKIRIRGVSAPSTTATASFY